MTAALYYRSLPEDLAKESGVSNPTTVMTSAESVVYGSEAALKAAAVGGVPEVEDPGAGGMLWIVVAGIVVIVGVLGYAAVASRNKPVARTSDSCRSA